ncbi:TPA: phage tail protein [Enterobacter kobei]
MSAKFYTLLTDIGAAKLASAAALGVPLKITQMAVGDGGGVLPTPSAQQTKLVSEKRRADLNMLYIDPQNSSQIIAEQVIHETEGGWWIREVGLFDETGALIAVGNCPESYKPQLAEGSGRTQTVRMVLITSSTDNITLKIDPSVVLATRKYVDDKVLELKVYVDELMAAHLAAADPHTQYAPKASPTFTGTPKAPTAAAGNNTTQLATTAFVQAALIALVNGAPATLDTLKEIAAAINNDPNFSTTINNALALKAPLASPALTGTPTAPTAAQTVNNTQIATTAFVKSALAALVDSSPAALDTLNELAAALGNDPNFATTMTNALAGKQPLDNTLTAMSGKSVAALLEYLGLGELAKTPRYLVTKGSNANGWYEVYSDGFIRQGMKFTNNNPLTISTPAAGEVVPFPTTFKSTITNISLALNAGVDNGLEFPGFTSESLSALRVLSMAVTNGANATGSYLTKFVGYIVVEGV